MTALEELTRLPVKEYARLRSREREKYKRYWEGVANIVRLGRSRYTVVDYNVESILNYEGSLFVDDQEVRALIISVRGTRKFLRKAEKGNDTPKSAELLRVQLELLEERLAEARNANPNSPAWTEVMTYLRK